MTTGLFRDAQPDAVPEPLDPALLRAIRPSASRMAAAEETFIRLLSEDVAALVRHLPDRGWQLCERTARTVLWVALSDQPTGAAIRAAHWLGEANQADGFPASDYVTVGHALVRIAREMSGIKWTTTTGSAWIRFFMWLQPHLHAGTRPPAAREEPVRPPAPREEPAHQEPAHQEPLYQQTVYQQAAHQQAVHQQAVHQQAVHQQAVHQQAVHQQAAYQEAAYQEAARQQAADREAARREAFDQPIRPTAADVVADISTLVDLLKGEAGPVPARDQTMPMTALERDE